MSYEIINTTRHKCHCEICGCDWESDHLPDRCSRCKRPGWNGDKRHKAFRGGKVTFNGKSLTVTQWAEELKLKENTLRQRLYRGWALEDCLTSGDFIPGRKPKE